MKRPLVRIAGEPKPWPTKATEQERRYHRAFDYLVAWIEEHHDQATAHQTALDAMGAGWNPKRRSK